MAIKKIITNVLLSFVLISVGFALGKAMTMKNARNAKADESGTTTLVGGKDRVIVYYMHQTFRCATCNEIEKLTDELLRADFADELKNGQIEWKKVNFQENEELASHYNVVSSSVVVSRIQNGKEAGHQTLDKVWTLSSDPDEFVKYVGGAIRKELAVK
jgi:hypothetical protein